MNALNSAKAEATVSRSFLVTIFKIDCFVPRNDQLKDDLIGKMRNIRVQFVAPLNCFKKFIGGFVNFNIFICFDVLDSIV